jgi:iron complex transport system substrate-binding protein
VQEILDTVLVMGRIVGASDRAEQLVRGYVARLSAAEDRARARTHKPRVYFEEWHEPTISAIQWVSELIELAGGVDIFADRARGKLAKERFVQPDEVVARAPEVYLASWCGKPFERELALSRPGFAELPAVRAGRVHEIDPAIILQPGPACVTDGLDTLERLLA